MILWNTVSWQQFDTLQGHSGEISSLCFSPDGVLVASGSVDSRVILWNAATGKQAYEIPNLPSSVNEIGFLGNYLLCLCGNNSVSLWDARSGRFVRNLEQHLVRRARMCLSPDRTLMMSYLQETELVMQDVVTGHGIYTVHSTSRSIRPECLSNDNEYIGCGTVDGA